jgi:putative SOS response-associated peptidase YedK
MCGRFVITSAPEAIRQVFGYRERPNFPARYNVAPTQPVPVVIVDNGERHFRLMRWGLLPSWVKDPRQFTLLINARAETVQEKPAFKNAIRRRRCLIPADGYYEWQNLGERKQPYFIHPSAGGPMGFAGLQETWMGPNGEELDTVALITAAASTGMSVLHHRVPVTIAPADFAQWLDCSGDSSSDVMTMLTAPRDGAFVWHPVSAAVGKVANDDAQLILPMTEAEIAVAEAAAPAKKVARKAVAVAEDGGQGSLF